MNSSKVSTPGHWPADNPRTSLYSARMSLCKLRNSLPMGPGFLGIWPGCILIDQIVKMHSFFLNLLYSCPSIGQTKSIIRLSKLFNHKIITIIDLSVAKTLLNIWITNLIFLKAISLSEFGPN